MEPLCVSARSFTSLLAATLGTSLDSWRLCSFFPPQVFLQRKPDPPPRFLRGVSFCLFFLLGQGQTAPKSMFVFCDTNSPNSPGIPPWSPFFTSAISRTENPPPSFSSLPKNFWTFGLFGCTANVVELRVPRKPITNLYFFAVLS